MSPSLEAEYKAEAKSEGAGIIMKPKQEIDVKSVKESETAGITLKPKEETVAKSAAQIVHEQNGKWVSLAPFFTLIFDIGTSVSFVFSMKSL